MLLLRLSSSRIRESKRSALETNTHGKLQESRTPGPYDSAQRRVNLGARRGIKNRPIIYRGPLRVVERVVCLGPQLHIDTFFNGKVLGPNYVPIINSGAVEYGAIPCRSDLAHGRQGKHIWVEIVVKSALALRQCRIPGEDHLGPIASTCYVFIVCRAQRDGRRLTGDERSDP